MLLLNKESNLNQITKKEKVTKNNNQCFLEVSSCASSKMCVDSNFQTSLSIKSIKAFFSGSSSNKTLPENNELTWAFSSWVPAVTVHEHLCEIVKLLCHACESDTITVLHHFFLILKEHLSTSHCWFCRHVLRLKWDSRSYLPSPRKKSHLILRRYRSTALNT